MQRNAWQRRHSACYLFSTDEGYAAKPVLTRVLTCVLTEALCEAQEDRVTLPLHCESDLLSASSWRDI